MIIDLRVENLRETVKEVLKEHVVKLTFIRADGTTRKMFATTQDAFLPKNTGHNRVVSPELQVVWDTEKNEYRSFKWERLIGVEYEEHKVNAE